MTVRIDVYATVFDARGAIHQKKFQEYTPTKIQSVRVVDSYSIDMPLSTHERALAAQVLTNPRAEGYTIGRFVPESYAWGIEVGYLPGVTDNVGHSAREAIEDGIGKKIPKSGAVYSSQVFYIKGNISREDVEEIAAGIHNPLIQWAKVSDAKTLKRTRTAPPVVPKVSLKGSSTVSTVDLEVSDATLEEMGRLGIQNPDGSRRGPLALPLQYLHAIRDYFRSQKRSPTDAEIEMFAQTWSEHCKHTIFASPLDDISDGIYKTYIKGATELIRKKKGKNDFCVSVFSDNSGGISFDDEFVITHKVETHNSPSALDPFGGAVTGIVGVNRDALGFGLGAKPVANTYGFCFAHPDDERKLYRDAARTKPMLSSKRIMEGVIAGVNAGGNQSGIPTPHGFMLFDPSYRGKPLVFVGTIGIIPKKRKGRVLYKKQARPGDYIVMVGGRVGLDGIHGATFSSVGLDSGSPATSVQIGDPITQKKFSDAIAKEARDLGLYNSITDNGAGGLSSSIGEMARESNGCHVQLEKVPLKYPGLTPWQIWISESQERMTLAVPKGKWKLFADLMKRRGVEATVIGQFTNSGRCEVSYGKKKVVSIDLEFLHRGIPTTPLWSELPAVPYMVQPEVRKESKDFSDIILNLLKQPNLSSHDFISTQFDHEVQAGSVLKPIQGKGRVGADASVFRPLLSSKKGVVLSSGIAPYYSDQPYRAAAASLDTAVRSAVAAGAPLSHLAILDNFCWPSGNDPERLWQLKESARACFDYATLYGTPFISGKDSMFNDFRGYDETGNPVEISVLPTLLISAIGIMKDAKKSVSIDFKRAGDLIYGIGETHDELGGSEYYRMLGVPDGSVPKVNGEKNLALYKALEKAIAKDLIASSVSLGRGGLAFALMRSSMAGGLGCSITLPTVSYMRLLQKSAVLFSESQGRVLVSVNPKLKKDFERLFAGLPLVQLGTVEDTSQVIIRNGKKKIAQVSVAKALSEYRSRFKNW